MVQANTFEISDAVAAIDVTVRKVGKDNGLHGEYPQGDVCGVEQAVALVFNGISHAVMMTTPVDLSDFAIGFSLTEGIIDSYADIREITINDHALGTEVQITISPRCFANLKTKRRSMAGNSGCGLCGVDSLAQAHKTVPPVKPAPLIAAAIIEKALAGFSAQQLLNQQTGGVHGVAFCDLAGEILFIREDVGRHNALDKLVGALLKANIDVSQGFILSSSRASFEMVYKTLMVGAHHLVTISAATSQAIAMAQENQLNLIGFARPNRQVIYNRALA